MMLVCGTLQTVLCYTRYDASVWHSPDCAAVLVCGTLDMMLVCGTLQTLLCYTRYDAGVWHSPDCAVLH